MPTQQKDRPEVMPILANLEPDEAEAVLDAIGLAVAHYTRKAEERRKLSETGLTISARRRAQAEALDLTAHARKLDALRPRFAQ